MKAKEKEPILNKYANISLLASSVLVVFNTYSTTLYCYSLIALVALVWVAISVYKKNTYLTMIGIAHIFVLAIKYRLFLYAIFTLLHSLHIT